MSQPIIPVEISKSMKKVATNMRQGIDIKFVNQCPRFREEREPYFSIKSQLADERFNQGALNNLRSML